jgi:alpha-galactosidase
MVNEELAPRFTDHVNHWFDFASHRRLPAPLSAPVGAVPERLRRDRGAANSRRCAATSTARSIIEAMETNKPAVIAGNVPNTGLITNLPDGCCVEVPCLVNASGIQPTVIGNLPPQLAALNRTNINVQSLIVEAALSGDTDAVYHAVMLDPLTAAVCTLPQIHSMVTEMLDAQEQWLPQF